MRRFFRGISKSRLVASSASWFGANETCSQSRREPCSSIRLAIRSINIVRCLHKLKAKIFLNSFSRKILQDPIKNANEIAAYNDRTFNRFQSTNGFFDSLMERINPRNSLGQFNCIGFNGFH